MTKPTLEGLYFDHDAAQQLAWGVEALRGEIDPAAKGADLDAARKAFDKVVRLELRPSGDVDPRRVPLGLTRQYEQIAVEARGGTPFDRLKAVSEFDPRPVVPPLKGLLGLPAKD